MKPTPSSPATFRPGRHLEVLDDPSHDPYQARGKLAEPTVCDHCGAVFHDGRWQWLTPPAGADHATCPACRRIAEKMPSGYLHISGSFAAAHRDELLALARHVEQREKADHPLQRIMDIADDADGGFMVTTTDIHLARDIGKAYEHAYHGTLDYHYNSDEYLLRVHWER